MKKVTAVILALVIALSAVFSLTFASFAANEPSYSVSFSREEAYQLDVVVVKININNNPGLISLRFQIVYDETVLKLLKVDDSGLLNGYTQPAPTVKSPYILRWADPIAPSNNTANGTVAQLTFKIKDGAAFGKTTVKVEHIESRQFDGTKNNFANASAEFTVVCTHPSENENIVKQATHTETGIKEIVCKECGEIFKTETIPALGHSFGAWTVTKPSTCTAKGEETRTCSCGAKETREIAIKAHTPGNWRTEKAPTCTEKGKEIQKCTVCSAVTATRELAAKGHDGKWSVTKTADCTHSGEKIQKCNTCQVILAKEILPALGHSFGEYVVTKEPTVTEKGEKTGTCSVCGEKSIVEIPAIGYKLGDVNGDGNISIIDAKMILQSVAGSRTLTELQRAAADLNKDGNITIVDAKWVLQIVAGTRDAETLKLK